MSHLAGEAPRPPDRRSTMAVAVPVRGASEMVPIAHETSARVARTLFFGVPPAALVAGGWMAWGGSPALARPDRLRRHLRRHRPRHHGGLPRAVHAPQLHEPTRALHGRSSACSARWRSRARSSTGSRPTASTTATPTTPEIRTAPTSATPPGWRGELSGLGHAHLGWMLRGKDMANPRRYATDLLADRDLRFIQPDVPSLGGGRARAAVRPRLGPHRLGSGRPDRIAVGRRRADLRTAPRDLQHQLALPCLWAAAVRDPRSGAQTSPGSPHSPSARHGTTTTTPSRPLPGSLAVADGSGGLAHRRPRALPARVGGRTDQPHRQGPSARVRLR